MFKQSDNMWLEFQNGARLSVIRKETEKRTYFEVLVDVEDATLQQLPEEWGLGCDEDHDWYEDRIVNGISADDLAKMVGLVAALPSR